MDLEDPLDQAMQEQTAELLQDEKSRQTYTIDDAINKLGIGRVQVIAMAFAHFSWLYVGIVQAWIALYTAYSHCSFEAEGWQLALVAQVAYCGRLSAGLLSGPLIDWFGRKKIVTLHALFCGYVQLLLSLAPTYSWLVLLCFLLGLTYGPIGSASLSYCSELQPSNYRKAIGVSLQASIFFGGALANLFCLLAVNQGWSWRVANVMSALFVLGSILFATRLPESLHYTISQRKIAEVERFLKRMAAENRAHLPHGRLIQSKEVVKQMGQDRKNSWKLLFTPLKMLFVTVGNILARFALSFSSQGYYYLTASISQLMNKEVSTCPAFGTTDFLNMIWSLSSELFGGVLAAIAMMLWRQRLVFFIFGLGSSLPVALLLLPTTTFTEAQTIALVFTGRAFTSALNQSAYVFVAEFFPSVARGKAFGLQIVAASVGSILGAYVGAVLALQNLFAAKAVFLSTAVMATICQVSLPDVTSKKLEETVFTMDGKRT